MFYRQYYRKVNIFRFGSVLVDYQYGNLLSCNLKASVQIYTLKMNGCIKTIIKYKKYVFYHAQLKRN